MGLFYTGHGHYKGKDAETFLAFTRDLAELFEQYVGRHVRLLPGAEVIPEISYGESVGKKSVDWIVVLPSLVLLVEVKSVRTTAGLRAQPPLSPCWPASSGAKSPKTALTDDLRRGLPPTTSMRAPRNGHTRPLTCDFKLTEAHWRPSRPPAARPVISPFGDPELPRRHDLGHATL
ncbi:hypothetical protein ACFCZV_24745 [Streptomyces hydrogenans]|uniref:hypothetical protein n=1 Tax=Streptomyces hydrogenans TaxID=1873719 RepID=UPI0035DBCF80